MDLSLAELAGAVAKLLTGCTEFISFVTDFIHKVKRVDLSLKLCCNEINSVIVILEQISHVVLESKRQSTEIRVLPQHSTDEFFDKWMTSMKDCEDLLKRWQMRLSKVYNLDDENPFRNQIHIDASEFEDLRRRVRVHFQNVHMFLSVWNL
jgi:hypothetical protein